VGGSTVAQTPEEADLLAAAQNFYSCMSNAGLPVAYANDVEGRSTLVTFQEGVWAIYAFLDAEGYPQFNYVGQVPEDAARQVYTDLAAADSEDATPSPAKALLIVDGVDHSDIYAACLDESEYDENAVYAAVDYSPMAELEPLYQLMIDASNEWAKCARENGFPTTKDAVMPKGEGQPMALLPASITEVELRELLAVCPNFDPAIVEANEKLYESMS
jgi:hypothetical protein